LIFCHSNRDRNHSQCSEFVGKVTKKREKNTLLIVNLIKIFKNSFDFFCIKENMITQLRYKTYVRKTQENWEE